MKRHARSGRETSRGTHLEKPPHNAVGRGRAVFISYAHADNGGPDPAARWLDRLLLNLKPLAFEDLIAVATDRDIGLGDDWHARIQADLNRAGAAVLLVSPAFLASEYIRNHELPVLLHRAKTQGLRIVPVILRPCLYAETRFKYPDPETGPEEFSLASLQAAGSSAKALNEMTEGEQDRASVAIPAVVSSRALLRRARGDGRGVSRYVDTGGRRARAGADALRWGGPGGLAGCDLWRGGERARSVHRAGVLGKEQAKRGSAAPSTEPWPPAAATSIRGP